MHEAMSRSLDHAERASQIREQLAALHGGEHPGVPTDLAVATALAGDFKAARELNARARTICVERFRVRRPPMFVALSDAAVDLARQMEEWDHVAEAAGRLSIVLRALGRPEEADATAQQSMAVAPADGVEAHAWSRAAWARALAHRGDLRRAEGLARDALSLVPDEMSNLRGDLMVRLAAVLRAADQAQAAAAILDDAAMLYERKGNVSGLAHCPSTTAHHGRPAGSTKLPGGATPG